MKVPEDDAAVAMAQLKYHNFSDSGVEREVNTGLRVLDQNKKRASWWTTVAP